MMFPVVMYVPKDFFLTAPINDKILLLQAAGLIEYWHTQIIDKRFLKEPVSKQPRGIKIEYLAGCFYLWAICLSGSILAFICELFSGKLRKSEKSLKPSKASFKK